ncbi:MAG: hypothetical protein KAH14_05895, partial [Clostridiales bacterium]|nr:hypothetical protein [Clostridiales bacterium]
MNTFVFFDDFMIYTKRGIRRRIFKPRQVGGFEKPGITSGNSVVYIPDLKKYYLFFSFLPDRSKDWDRRSHYAISDDGINFTPMGPVPSVRKTGSYVVYRDDKTDN